MKKTFNYYIQILPQHALNFAQIFTVAEVLEQPGIDAEPSCCVGCLASQTSGEACKIC